jgi:miniconductance mechanosensitive channel
MLKSDGRRIKRHVLIKANSVRFIETHELEKFKKIQHLSHYIEHRQSDIDKFNQNNSVDKSVIVNGRNLTNLGLFRKYINQYLQSHPGINKDMMLMVRHLQPTEKGIPLEIYCFSKDKIWENYEHIMADIFDHIIASVYHFELEIFESLSNPKSLNN